MNKIPVVVLAGSPKERDTLMEAADVDYKALIDINGKPMINYVLEAIKDSGIASYILIVGIQKDIIKLPDGFDESIVEFYSIEGSQADKVHKTCQKLLEIAKSKDIFPEEKYHFLHISGDVPTITPEIIKEFHLKTIDHQVDFYYPVVSKSVMDKKFPNNGRSFMHLEDYFAGGDLIIAEAEILTKRYDKIKLVTENRKSFIKGIFFASPIIFFKYILKRIKLSDVDRVLTKIFKVKSKLIISENAEIAFDVDKPYQLDIVREYLKNNN